MIPLRGLSDYEEAAAKNPPLTRAGEVGDDAFWERINYFLERVVPVAAENKVRIACHPQDPGVDIGFRLWNTKSRRQPPQPLPVEGD